MDVVEVDDRDVEEVVLDDVMEVLKVVDVVVVVVSQPLQVLAQCVMLATRLSHRPCNLKVMHWLGDNVSFLPSQRSTAAVPIAEVDGNDVDVDPDVQWNTIHVHLFPTGRTNLSRPIPVVSWPYNVGPGRVYCRMRQDRWP